MSSGTERPLDELRLVATALREHLRWQEACGAYGLSRAERRAPVREAPQPERASRVAAAERAEGTQRAEGMRVEGTQRAEVPRPELVPQIAQVEPKPAPPRVVVPRAAESSDVRAARLASLAAEVKLCERCPLHTKRTNVVVGIGPVDPEIMIVGEGPGAEEDRLGEPFVGKAGQLLDRMLGAMGYARSDVYIGNVIKCRPPDNRTPEQDEIDACMPYLREQIALVRPKVIIAMGTTAVRGLLNMGGITRIRGRWKLYDAEIPVMPTFHPAYLLRNEAAKRDVWEDLKAVLKQLNREVPARKR